MAKEWFKNALIYQVLIDRFSGADISSNRPGFLGGNIRGITQKLDYISDLGMNTIWLSPFCSTSEYHGYHVTDYKNVDPHFGTIDDLKHLIDKGHEKSIRVIADFVPNHCSVRHPWFLEAGSNRHSKYYSWFYFKKWPEDYLSFLNVKELAKLNLDNPEVRDYFIEVAGFWLSMGLDGYRIDHIIGPSHKFWDRFYTRIKKQYPECILFGEAWGEGLGNEYFETVNFKNKFLRRFFGINQEHLQREYSEVFDGIIDFKVNEIITGAAANGQGFTADEKFKIKVKEHFSRYPANYLPVLFLDNHDMNRFLYYCKGDHEVLLEALEFLLSANKPVVIYYGTESGMYNKEPVMINKPYSDLSVREPFDWDRIDYDLYNRVQTLLKKHRVAGK